MRERRISLTCIFILAVLFLLPLISAVDTKVKITTLSDHDINVNFLNPSPPPIQFESFKLDSGPTGEVEFVFSSEKPNFDITSFVMKDGQKVVYQRFNGNIAGESLHLILIPGSIQLIKNYEQTESTENETSTNETIANEVASNETSTNETAVVTEENESRASITGLATSEDKSSILSNKIIYYALGILALLIVVFFSGRLIQSRRGQYPGREKDIKVIKLSDLKAGKEESGDDYKRAIEEAEKKIEEAQKEIRSLKNKGRIEEVKKRLVEDEKELIRLRKGEE